VKTGFVGYEVILPCTSTVFNVSVTWFDETLNSHRHVYERGEINEDYRNVVSDEPVNESVGDYTLVLKNVSRRSSGVYVCVEDGGNGNKHAVTVNVSGQ
jgi:hypothetical protein